MAAEKCISQDVGRQTETKDPEFRWGIKGGTGKDRTCQFYKSFFLGDTEYSLYDCVKVFKEGEPEPYLARIAKMWEDKDAKKNPRKLKLLWFFHPSEVANFVPADAVSSKKEIFLASGQGKGVFNINALEVVTAKCGILCTVDDPRNPKPTQADLDDSEFFFDRTFNVDNLCLSNNFGDLEDPLVFNKASWVNKKPRIAKDDDNSALLSKELITKDQTQSAKEDGPSTSAAKDIRNQDVKKQISAMKDSDASASTGRDDSNKNTKKHILGSEVRKTSEGPKVPNSQKRTGESESKKHARLEQNTDGKVRKHSIDGYLNEPAVKKMKVNDGSGKVVERKPLPQKPDTEKIIKDGREILVITKRPEASTSAWFKGLPWDDELRKGYEQKAVIQLHNFDRSYKSSEIEDIMWHVFAERCTAKVLPRTAFSNPESGEALVVFKSRGSAENALIKLNKSCLILSDGRPLVARKASSVPFGSVKYAGHISVVRQKLIINRAAHADDMKRAVATSHCSQPNTIEYEMAMEWRLIQEKSERWWKELYKKSSEEGDKGKFLSLCLEADRDTG